MTLGRILCVGVALAGFSGMAHASPFFDSYAGNTPDGSYSVSSDGPLGSSFTTGVTSIRAIQIQIQVGLSSLDSTGSFLLFIANSVTGSGANLGNPQPGSVVDSIATVFDSSISSTEPQTLTFTAALSTALDPNTRYWVGLQQGDSGTNAVWEGGLDNVNTASQLDEWYFLDGTSGQNSGGPFLMALTDTSGVPEPGSLSILGMGLLGIAALGRRWVR